MLVHGRLWTLGLVFLMLAAFLVVAPPARAAASRPVWSTGNYWEYEISGAISPSGEAGTMRIDVVGQDSVTVGSATYPTYRTNLTFNVTIFGSPYEIHGNAWFRTTDLAPVKLNFSFSIVIIVPFTTSVTITYDPPLRIEWPLTAGDSWDLASTVTIVATITGSPPEMDSTLLSATVEVDADETVTVPAGTFTTTPVRQQEPGGNTSESHWADEAGNSVEEKSYDSTGDETSSMELTSYSYTPPSGTPGAETLFGLPWYLWLLFVLIAGAAVAAFLLLRRRPPATMPMPPGAMPPQAPPGPPMEPGPPGGPPAPPP